MLVAACHAVYVAGLLKTAIVSVYVVQTKRQFGVKRQEAFGLTMEITMVTLKYKKNAGG